MALGAEDSNEGNDHFNMAVMALKNSARANGVANCTDRFQAYVEPDLAKPARSGYPDRRHYEWDSHPLLDL